MVSEFVERGGPGGGEEGGGERARRGEGSWGARVVGWMGSNEVRLFAIAVSLFVHVALLLAMANLVFERSVASASIGPDGETPLAVIAEVELSEMVKVSLASEAPSLDVGELEMVTSEDFASPVSDAALASLELTELGDYLGAGEEELTEGMEGALGGGGAASFFGVEARGSRFAYVVDISLSMADDRLAALKVALGESVDALLEHTHFAIVLYNSDAYPLSTRGWIPATDRSKRDTRRNIRGIRATGGTNPVPAFEIVFSMKPRPDAVYFMTDGQFQAPDRVAARIARLNERGLRRTAIHCITFIDDSAAEIMRSIARRSGGTYTHVRSVGQ